MNMIRFCIKSILIRNPVYGYSKMPHRVRNVKYPAYGYDNTLYGNRINQISKSMDINE